MTTRISQVMANTIAAAYAADLNGKSAVLYGDAIPATLEASTAGNTDIATFTVSASASANVVTLVGAVDIADNSDTATFMRIGTTIQGDVGAEVIIADPAIIQGSNVNIVSMTLTVPLA